MKLPEIMKKNMADILREIQGKIPFYTPEWTLEDEDDMGVSLSTIFAYFSEIAAKRLNQAPTRHFLGFLETIDSSLLPVQPARAPLSFVLSEGASENVLIPASTEAAASDKDGKPILFQTEKNFMASPSKLVSVFSADTKSDGIFDHTPVIGGGSPASLFMGDNLQEHTLYVGDENLFNIHRKAKIRLHIEPPDGNLLDRLKNDISWAYGVEVIQKKNGQEIKEIGWLPLKAGLEKTSQGRQVLVLAKEEDRPIDETGLNGLKSRWIKGTLAKGIGMETVKDMKISSLAVSILPEVSEETSVKNVQGIGDTYYEALVKNMIETIEELLKLSPDQLAECLHCSQTRAQNILEAAKKAFYDKTGRVAPITAKDIPPDLLFYNDVPFDVEKEEIYPFGKKPQKQDTFYIASEDAFSKKNYEVKLTFDIVPGQPSVQSDQTPNTPQLSWEYWDGEGWNRLDVAPQENWATDQPCEGRGPGPPRESRTVTILSMPEVKRTKANGKENYWIRVRLVGGDYGREFKIQGNQVTPGQYCAPVIKALSIDYWKDDGDSPEHLLTKNNLKLEEVREEFTPFESLPDTFPAVYLGFDQALKGGPFSLFVSLDERFEYPEESYPRVRWQYESQREGGSWIEFDTLDETRGFTRTGMIQFVISDDMKAVRRLGEKEDRYWIRAAITENFPDGSQPTIPEPKGLRIGGTQSRDDLARTLYRKRIEIPNISLTAGTLKEALPEVNGFFANSTWAFQSRTVKDELLGSSTGEAGQSFNLMNTPVVKEEVWVNEVNSLSEGERRTLLEDGSPVAEGKDDLGNVIEFWVQWKEQSDFILSGSADRHYRIDRTTGEISFGDGEHGAIPPAGLNNIKATYATGGGKTGNVPADSIQKLQSAIPFVDRVYNPVAADGGADTEDSEGLIKRAPSVLKHRHRATALEDYEWLVKEASRLVARVKVLPNFNSQGSFETGWVTVIVVPGVSDVKPTPSPELRRRVETFLKGNSPNVASVRVIPPSYVKIDVTSDIVTQVIDAVPSVEREAKKRIEDFLHPLTGGPKAEGWPFGAIPCVSDIYAIFEEIEDVDHVRSVSLTLHVEDSKTVGITDTPDAFELPEYVLPYSGEHAIAVHWEEEKEN
jgi:predicted phage baseplate assembly protein